MAYPNGRGWGCRGRAPEAWQSDGRAAGLDAREWHFKCPNSQRRLVSKAICRATVQGDQRLGWQWTQNKGLSAAGDPALWLRGVACQVGEQQSAVKHTETSQGGGGPKSWGFAVNWSFVTGRLPTKIYANWLGEGTGCARFAALQAGAIGVGESDQGCRAQGQAFSEMVTA